jgi:LysM repeat protein
MATRSKASSRRERDSDVGESLKPLVVLALLGTILYGAWSVVAKSPSGSPTASEVAGAATPFTPQVEMPTPVPSPVATAASTSTPPAFAPAATGSAAFVASPPPPSAAPPAIAEQPPTYLSAVSAPPPVADPLPEASGLPGALQPPVAPPAAFGPSDASRSGQIAGGGKPAAGAAFASSWADAHDKLAAGRYAEALSVLSAWYDDPSLGPEESQRLEDVLNQLAGSVVYSQQDLLQPPHVVEAGETLQAIATQLGVPWQLLAKINGVPDPNRLVPGESLKVLRGPFNAVVSVSRRRLSLQVGGNYAGSLPVVVGRQIRERVGATLPVVSVQGGEPAAEPRGPAAQVAWSQPGPRSIALSEGLAIAGAADPAVVTEEAIPPGTLLVSARDLDELVDILGPGSQVIVRQ